MATFSEVNKAYKTIFKYNKKISLLHCVSAYPAKPISCNFKFYKILKKKFKCAIGWSDHTVNPIIIYNVIKSQKADIIELHFDLEGLGWEEKEETIIVGFRRIKKIIELYKDGKCNKW